MSPSSSKEPQRIAKLLARAGIASRRDIERMIAEGRIALNGNVLETPATLLTSLAGVTVDGKPVAAPAPARLFRYHKPAGLLTAARDPKGRATIYDRLPPGLPRVMPVGRLDLNTEGLLLLTTDGELKRQLELPSSGVERSYRARAFGNVTQAQLEELIEGVEIDGVRYGQIDANLERRTGANVWIELTLTEGKNREVRRVLEYLGLQVSRLIRTRYGPFHLGDMPSGDADEIRQHDLITFRKALAGPGGGKTASRLQFAVRARALPPPAAPAEPEGAAARPVRRATRATAPEPAPADAARGQRRVKTAVFSARTTPAPATDREGRAIARPARAARAKAHREEREPQAGDIVDRPRRPRKPGTPRPQPGGAQRGKRPGGPARPPRTRK